MSSKAVLGSFGTVHEFQSSSRKFWNCSWVPEQFQESLELLISSKAVPGSSGTGHEFQSSSRKLWNFSWVPKQFQEALELFMKRATYEAGLVWWQTLLFYLRVFFPQQLESDHERWRSLWTTLDGSIRGRQNLPGAWILGMQNSCSSLCVGKCSHLRLGHTLGLVGTAVASCCSRITNSSL